MLYNANMLNIEICFRVKVFYIHYFSWANDINVVGAIKFVAVLKQIKCISY